jgi:hypothetical protein
VPTNLPYGYAPDDPVPEPELPPVAPPPRQSWEQRLKRRLGPLGVLIFAAAMWAAKLKVLLLAVTKI